MILEKSKTGLPDGISYFKFIQYSKIYLWKTIGAREKGGQFKYKVIFLLENLLGSDRILGVVEQGYISDKLQHKGWQSNINQPENMFRAKYLTQYTV